MIRINRYEVREGAILQKKQKIVAIVALISLTILLLFSIRMNHEYKSYLVKQNEYSISSFLSSIRNNTEILNEYKKTDNMTYAELSSIGNNYLYAGIELKDLLEQVKHFMSDADYSNENYNSIIIYLDGISLFVSMDILKGIGNHYPHMYNETVYELDDDEKLILGHIFDMNQRFNAIMIEKGFMSNELVTKAFTIDEGKHNGLDVLSDFIDAVANESKDYFDELKHLENSQLVQKFILDVSGNR